MQENAKVDEASNSSRLGVLGKIATLGRYRSCYQQWTKSPLLRVAPILTSNAMNKISYYEQALWPHKGIKDGQSPSCLMEPIFDLSMAKTKILQLGPHNSIFLLISSLLPEYRGNYLAR